MKGEKRPALNLHNSANICFIIGVFTLLLIIYETLKPLYSPLACIFLGTIFFIFGVSVLRCIYDLLITISKAADDISTIAEYAKRAQRQNMPKEQPTEQQPSVQTPQQSAEPYQRRWRSK